MRLFFLNCFTFLLLSSSVDAGMSEMISNQITRTVNSSISKNLFDNLIIPQLKVKNSSGKILAINLSQDQRYLSLLLEDGTARIWDLNIGVQRPIIHKKDSSIIAISSSPQLQTLYSATATSIDLYDLHTARLLSSFPITEHIQHMAVSTDDLLLVTSHKDNNLTAWNTKTQSQHWHNAITEADIQQIKINNTSQFLAVLTRKSGLFSSSDQLEIRSSSDGLVTKTLNNNGNKIIAFHFSSAETIESTYENGDIIQWNILTGAQLASKNIGHTILSASKANNGFVAYAINKDNIAISNSQGTVISNIFQEGLSESYIQFLANGAKLVSTQQNGKATLWNTETGENILQLISTKQGWSVVDSVGRFDSSENGMSNISWQANEQDIPIDSFSSKYYEPGLLATALNDEIYINSKPAPVQKGISLPPELELIITNVKNTGKFTELTVEISGQGGGIDKVNLYHNKKVVSASRAVINDKKSTKNNREHRIMKMQVNPAEGKNSVKVMASNKMGIEGQSDEVEFTINKKTEKPTLRIISIGVNEYSDPQLNLDYSVPDAQTILNLLKKNTASTFSAIEKRQLYNASATKLAIMSELVNLSAGAANDVLAIYFAGHGISVNGEWYFLPHETTLQPDLNYFTQVGISAAELSSIFIGSKIQHILLMVDACYSGASVDSFRRLQNSQRHFSREISKSVGITVVTATRKDQQAAELTELGHGLFTYVLSKGMRGDADWWPKNNKISAHELAKFSTETIPQFSKKFLGAAQEPTAFTMGKDFHLISIKKDSINEALLKQ